MALYLSPKVTKDSIDENAYHRGPTHYLSIWLPVLKIFVYPVRQKYSLVGMYLAGACHGGPPGFMS